MKNFFRLILAVSLVLASPGVLPARSVLYPDFSTYLGGSGQEGGSGIALDSADNIYVCGYTYSSNFPVVAPAIQQFIVVAPDAFVSKFSSTGSTLLYSTYLGGSDYDNATALFVGAQDGAYLTGYTVSSDFPTTAGVVQPRPGGGGSDAFVTRLSSAGSALGFSTYLGGGDIESAHGITLDGGGYIYVTGSTYSQDFPTVNPYQASYSGGGDVFVTQLYNSGTGFYYSTYLGGSGEDMGLDIAVDDDDEAYVVGYAISQNFPTVNPYQAGKNPTNRDAFVSKLSVSGSTLVYSTYLGGSDMNDSASGVAVDDYEMVYITGYTAASDFPTVNPYQASRQAVFSETDAFVTCLDSAGSSLAYSTYLGGSDSDAGLGIVVEPTGYADTYIVGYTNSTNFPVLNAYQSNFGGGGPAGDAFLANLNGLGDQLHGSTYLGGVEDDVAYAVVRDSNNNAYLAGYTKSGNFPIRNAYQSSLDGTNSDCFVAKFSWGAPPADGDYHTDFNGDGVSDIAIFRPSSGMWAVRGITRVYFGSSSDTAVPGDYNGDGTTECAVFRGTGGLWAVRGITRVYFGSSSDSAVPADYDGDGTWDIAIFRGSSGLWSIRGVTRSYFGSGSDAGVPGDYNGDGSMDIALFRGSTGLWAMKGIGRVYFGGGSDTPVPGDYNGDGTWEAAIFRSGLWAVRGVTRAYFGGSWDHSVPGDYNGVGGDDIGIFKPSSGLWAVQGVTRIYFGGTGDLPVTR